LQQGVNLLAIRARPSPTVVSAFVHPRILPPAKTPPLD
jgi:hypothetical protein